MNIVEMQGSLTTHDFSALKLRAGTWLKVKRMDGGSSEFEVEFVAALQKKFLFVTMEGAATAGDRLKLGERYQLSGFNGVSDFSFTSTALEVKSMPFVHVHFSYPDSVGAMVVRRELRVNASLSASVSPEGVNKPVPVNVKNISVAGASIESVIPLGVSGDRIEVRIPTQFEARETVLKLTAVIRHVSNPSLTGGVRSGIEFEEIPREEKLVLYYLLFTLGEAGL